MQLLDGYMAQISPNELHKKSTFKCFFIESSLKLFVMFVGH